MVLDCGKKVENPHGQRINMHRKSLDPVQEMTLKLLHNDVKYCSWESGSDLVVFALFVVAGRQNSPTVKVKLCEGAGLYLSSGLLRMGLQTQFIHSSI